jgi:hypothetical protein
MIKYYVMCLAVEMEQLGNYLISGDSGVIKMAVHFMDYNLKYLLEDYSCLR